MENSCASKSADYDVCARARDHYGSWAVTQQNGNGHPSLEAGISAAKTRDLMATASQKTNTV